MYANFYAGETCLFSIEIKTEKEGEHLADRVYGEYREVNDWTITDTPMGKSEAEHLGLA